MSEIHPRILQAQIDALRAEMNTCGRTSERRLKLEVVRPIILLWTMDGDRQLTTDLGS